MTCQPGGLKTDESESGASSVGLRIMLRGLCTRVLLPLALPRGLSSPRRYMPFFPGRVLCLTTQR